MVLEMDIEPDNSSVDHQEGGRIKRQKGDFGYCSVFSNETSPRDAMNNIEISNNDDVREVEKEEEDEEQRDLYGDEEQKEKIFQKHVQVDEARKSPSSLRSDTIGKSDVIETPTGERKRRPSYIKANSVDNPRNQTSVKTRLRGASRALQFLRQAASSISITKHFKASSSGFTNQSDRDFSNTPSIARSSSTHFRQSIPDIDSTIADNQTCQTEDEPTPMESYTQTRAELDSFWFHSEFPIFMVPRFNDLSLPISCRIISVDDKIIREIFIHRHETGQQLMDILMAHLNLVETRFYGLKLIETRPDLDDLRSPWIEHTESVFEQLKRRSKQLRQVSNRSNIKLPKCPKNFSTRSIDFLLRFRYYPPHFEYLGEPFLRDYLWLQLRRDMRLSKLISSPSNMIKLTAWIMQYELGNFKPELVKDVVRMDIFPGQKMIEQQAIEFWRTKLMDLTQFQVINLFLRAAMFLETYGFDLYPVKHHQLNSSLLLGFNFVGIKAMEANRIAEDIRWHNVSKVCSEGKIIIIRHRNPKDVTKKSYLGFKCQSIDECHLILHRILDHKYFFTVDLIHFNKPMMATTLNGPRLSAIPRHHGSLNHISRSSSGLTLLPVVNMVKFSKSSESVDEHDTRSSQADASLGLRSVSQQTNIGEIREGSELTSEQSSLRYESDMNSSEIHLERETSNSKIGISQHDVMSNSRPEMDRRMSRTEDPVRPQIQALIDKQNEIKRATKMNFNPENSAYNSVEYIRLKSRMFNIANTLLENPTKQGIRESDMRSNETIIRFPLLHTCFMVIFASLVWHFSDIIFSRGFITFLDDDQR